MNIQYKTISYACLYNIYIYEYIYKCFGGKKNIFAMSEVNQSKLNYAPC